MFDKFGEFDSAEEINRAVAAQKKEGDTDAIYAIAEENGMDKEDVEDYLDGIVETLTTPLMAALGKIRVEERDLNINGILEDWVDLLIDECRQNQDLQIAVRRKSKSLKCLMAIFIKFAFENKVRVSDKIVNVTKVIHDGKEEAMRKPLYLGIPNRLQVKQMIEEYYLG